MTSIYQKEVVMIEKYFETPLGLDEDAHKRLVAVAAAIDIIKSAISTEAGPRSLDYEITQMAGQIAPLADAIQDAIEPEDN